MSWLQQCWEKLEMCLIRLMAFFGDLDLSIGNPVCCICREVSVFGEINPTISHPSSHGDGEAQKT